MKTLVFLSLFFLGALASEDTRFSCNECVREMHNLGRLIYDGAPHIEEYLKDAYCPTIDVDQEMCREDLTAGYAYMLFAVVNHFFVDGALHVCQTGGVCDVYAREYTCDECVEGLKWVEAYMEDPIQVAEYTLYLMQNVCTDDRCKDLVAEHFPPMHWMAMEKFMIPVEICNTEPVCTGEDPPTRPPFF